jgi:outer membrane lipoprotein LolB
VARAEISSFLIEGRLSATDGEHAANGRLEWAHARTGNQWTVSNPFGQIVARLHDGPAGAELRLSDGKTWQAASATELIPELFPELADADLPADLLAGWTQAALRKEAEVRELDAVGRPALAIDRGWRIEYFDYVSDHPDALPRRLDISRGNFRLRLIVDQWEIPAQ